jgi:hypothetical protein
MNRAEQVNQILRKRIRKFSAAGKSVKFPIQRQEQTNWCWAAVSATVVHYFNAETSWSQCDIVSDCLGEDACDTDASSPTINKAWYLDEALRVVGCLRQMKDRKVSYETVSTEISARRPLGIRLQWRGGGGHFVVIRGWFKGDDDSMWYIVEDPAKRGGGTIKISAANLERPNGFRGKGSWSHSYFVTNPGVGGSDAGGADFHDPTALGA